MDDGNTMFYWVAFHETKGISSDEWRKFCGAEIGVDIDENFRKIRTLDNNFLQDREAMKNGDFTGIYGIPSQDMAMWESMGSVADRTKDYLGVSDGAVAQFRRVMISAARDFLDGKPAIATRAAGRSVALGDLASYEGMIPKDSDWKQGLTYRAKAREAA
jgi:phthalate 4,5-dioxygenase oxygenase subunit